MSEKLAVRTRPNSYGSILTSGEDVVCVGIDGSNSATVSVINFPKLGTFLDIETAEETVTPPGHDSLVVLGNEATDSTGNLVW